MKSNVFGQAPTADADYKLLLKKVAGKVVILLADDPVFTVFAVSDSYPKAVRQARDAMTGRGFFEILPEGPDLSHAQTMENVRSSFCKVLATQESDTIPVAQQYDLPHRPRRESRLKNATGYS